MTSLHEQIDSTLAATRTALLSRRAGVAWRGRLSSSALSTATASFALAQMDAAAHRAVIDRGLAWLRDHQNADGGWGDTPHSVSNLSTTLLAWSALSAGVAGHAASTTAARAEAYIASAAGSLEGGAIADAVNAAYGGDRTFSAPILTMCVLAGRLGDAGDAWRHVAPLPFEVALAGHGLLRFLRVPVVSYALPALIAIGQVRHHHRPPASPWARLVRPLARKATLAKLARIQPLSGGYLEAAPLTSFVVMSLAAMGRRDHPAAVRGVDFLLASVRPDGSWPIDTDLATWTTTLSVTAMGDGLDAAIPAADRAELLAWLIGQQHRVRHPYTGAAAGGWAWTDLSGGVPDADDTAGALVALSRLAPPAKADGDVFAAVEAGLGWLLDLQNRDGGVPTFCRGWGRLPFDRSSPDLTAHALVAWRTWRCAMPQWMQAKIDHATVAAMAFLGRSQRAGGSWTPLWFGNQLAPHHENPVYGTARVLEALAALPPMRMRQRGIEWLLAAQSREGGWGGDGGVAPTIEETAIALGALAPLVGDQPSIRLGTQWLVEHTGGGTQFAASPIGLYFAKLWYHEELYPVIFTASALGRVRACLR